MTYELINAATTNTLACFNTRNAAEEARERLREENPELGGMVQIVAFDEEGLALEDEEPSPGSFGGGLPIPGVFGRLIGGLTGDREPERV